MADRLIDFPHDYGDNPCGKRLFRLRRILPSRGVLRAGDVVLLKGESPFFGDRIVCESCGQSPRGDWLRMDALTEVTEDG